MTGFVHDEASIFIPSIFDKSGGYDVHFYEALLDELSSGFLNREKVQSGLICLYPPAINNSRKNVETYMQVLIFFYWNTKNKCSKYFKVNLCAGQETSMGVFIYMLNLTI